MKHRREIRRLIRNRMSHLRDKFSIDGDEDEEE